MWILIVDDSATQRVALARMLKEEGYSNLLSAASAADAFEQLAHFGEQIDLILTDLNMPEINGIQVCQSVKQMENWRDIPIIMVTTSEEIDDLQAAFEAGAMDYITKPPRKADLLVRVRSALKLKHEMDQRKAREQELRDEKERSEHLLLNVLPAPIAERLKWDDRVIADRYEEATVMFADLVGFTPYAAHRPPQEVVAALNIIFSEFDTLAEKHGLEKIKTIGDAYMVVAGVPVPRQDHAHAIIEMALDMLCHLPHLIPDLQLRIGIHTGPVVAGVIGRKKFIYDVWGDTVNIASRMESHGCINAIHVSEETYHCLYRDYEFEMREPIQIKGKGEMKTYILMPAL